MLTAPLFVYKADRESIPHVGRFRISVEIDRILALHALAVAGTFDAPKRHVVVKARRRQIDHSKAAADIQAEMVGVLKRARANPRRQTEIGTVGAGQGFFVKIGRAWGRERVCQSMEISEVAGTIKIN